MNNLLNKFLNNSDSLTKEETEKLLSRLREEVNGLDKEIAVLLIRRIKTSQYIAKAKRLLNLSSYSPEREKKILENVLSLSEDKLTRKILTSIYERIIDESRGIQKMRPDNEE